MIGGAVVVEALLFGANVLLSVVGADSAPRRCCGSMSIFDARLLTMRSFACWKSGRDAPFRLHLVRFDILTLSLFRLVLRIVVSTASLPYHHRGHGDSREGRIDAGKRSSYLSGEVSLWTLQPMHRSHVSYLYCCSVSEMQLVSLRWSKRRRMQPQP